MFTLRQRGDRKCSHRSERRRSRQTRALIPLLNPLEERVVLSNWLVTSALDDGPGTLRQVVGAASPGDNIYFASSVSPYIILSAPITIDKSLDINGPGSNSLALSGQGASQIFKIDPGTLVRIYDLTFYAGYATEGGAIESDHANLVLARDNFVSNSAFVAGNDGRDRLGGAIHASGGSLEVYSCQFSANQAWGADSSRFDPEFSRPTDANGGAIFVDGSAINIQNSKFTNNRTIAGDSLWSVDDGGTALGGAVCAINTSDFQFYGNTFINDQTFGGRAQSGGGVGGAAEGGALYVLPASSSRVILSDNTFTSNSATAGRTTLSTDAAPDAKGGAAMVNASGSSNVTVSFFGTNRFVSNTASGGLVESRGSNYYLAGTGGNAMGGGLAIDMTGAIAGRIEQTFTPYSIVFQQNSAIGGDGGGVTLDGESLSAWSGGWGGTGSGGGMAISLDASIDCSLSLLNLNFQKNQAVGGKGGPGFFSSTAGDGGRANGGGISLTQFGAINAHNYLQSASFLSNTATGGAGTNPGLLGGSGVSGQPGSSGGTASGGGFWFDGSGSLSDTFFPLHLFKSSFSGNTAQGGNGGPGGVVSGGVKGGTGGRGGAALGGAFHGELDGATGTALATIMFDTITFSSNTAQGGVGGVGGTAQGVGVGGDGGDGATGGGGAVMVSSPDSDGNLTFNNINAVGNRALGGSGGARGTGPSGNGLGGTGGEAYGGAFFLPAPTMTATFTGTSNITLNRAQGGLPGTGSTRAGNSFGGGIFSGTRLTLRPTVRVLSNQANNGSNIYGSYDIG